MVAVFAVIAVDALQAAGRQAQVPHLHARVLKHANVQAAAFPHAARCRSTPGSRGATWRSGGWIASACRTVPAPCTPRSHEPHCTRQNHCTGTTTACVLPAMPRRSSLRPRPACPAAATPLSPWRVQCTCVILRKQTFKLDRVRVVTVCIAPKLPAYTVRRRDHIRHARARRRAVAGTATETAARLGLPRPLRRPQPVLAQGPSALPGPR